MNEMAIGKLPLTFRIVVRFMRLLKQVGQAKKRTGAFGG